MIDAPNILADFERIEDLLYIALLLALGAVGAIVSWFKKQAEKRHAERLKRRIEDQQKGHAWQEGQPTGQGIAPAEPAEEMIVLEPTAPPQDRVPQRPAVPPPMTNMRRRRPAATPAAPVVLPPAETHLANFEVEMPSAGAHEAHSRHVARGRVLNLSDPATLRQAIVLREILDPPIALREPTGQW